MRQTAAQAGPAWKTSARDQKVAASRKTHKTRKFYLGFWLIALLCVIEGLLAARIVGQATSQNPQWFPFAATLWVTDFLVEPFRDIKPEPALKETGVIEFSTLLAFEAYLVVGLVLLFLVEMVHIFAAMVRFFRRGSRKQAPVVAIVETPAAAPAELPGQQAEGQQAA